MLCVAKFSSSESLMEVILTDKDKNDSLFDNIQKVCALTSYKILISIEIRRELKVYIVLIRLVLSILYYKDYRSFYFSR